MKTSGLSHGDVVHKAALDKAWNTDIKPWLMRDDVRKLAEFETFSIEGVEFK